MRSKKKYEVSLTENLNKQLLHWSQKFEEVVLLDSNDKNNSLNYSKYTAILAVDAFTAVKTDYDQAFKKLEEYQSKTNDWLFGYLTYDLKNDIELLKSNNFDGLHFPDLYFFQPKRIFLFTNAGVEIQYLNCVEEELETDWEDILNQDINTYKFKNESTLKILSRTPKEIYFNRLNKILEYIQRGDIYE